MMHDSAPREEIFRERNLEEVYNSGVPETPANFPKSTTLSTTNIDYLRKLLRKGLSSGKEVEGHIDRKGGSLSYSPPHTGGRFSILPLGSYARAYTNSPAFIYAHTHPDGFTSTPSQGDIGIFSSLPRSADIFAIVSNQSTLLICQTKETNRIPFSAVVRGGHRYTLRASKRHKRLCTNLPINLQRDYHKKRCRNCLIKIRRKLLECTVDI